MFSIPNPFRMFHPFFNRYTGGEERPVFFDIDVTFPELRLLDRNVEVIQKELSSILLERDSIPRYHEVDNWQYKISGADQSEKDWKVFILFALGEKPEKNRRRAPETCKLLEEVPDLFQAFFSILDPGKSIPAHEGPYQGYIRYHLGLKVPRKNPPQIRVKDQYYTWKEKQSVLFDDSWEHEVINHSEEERIVLIVDVFRPLPNFPNNVNKTLYKIFGGLYGKKIMKFFQ